MIYVAAYMLVNSVIYTFKYTCISKNTSKLTKHCINFQLTCSRNGISRIKYSPPFSGTNPSNRGILLPQVVETWWWHKYLQKRINCISYTTLCKHGVLIMCLNFNAFPRKSLGRKNEINVFPSRAALLRLRGKSTTTPQLLSPTAQPWGRL